jgi:hypothetical protein
MARQVDFRSTLPQPADAVFAVMIDPEYLRARLRQIGGPGAELLEHTADADGARYRLRHGIDASALPPLVATLVSGNLVIERTETVRRQGSDGYGGQVDVLVPGTPVSAHGSSRLHDVSQTDGSRGSEFAVQAEVTVNVPLFGGRIEETIVGNIQQLLAAETAFTEEWLRRSG